MKLKEIKNINKELENRIDSKYDTIWCEFDENNIAQQICHVTELFDNIKDIIDSDVKKLMDADLTLADARFYVDIFRRFKEKEKKINE